MSERGLPIVDGAPACPFVAFEDDRDGRSLAPDHRHRCFAEPRPAPRALAHQEAYCLSSAFPVCPTFQDWARREAAAARPGATRPDAGDPEPMRPDVPAAAIADAVVPRPDADDPSASPVERAAPASPKRNSQRDWAAPPPWVAEADDQAPDDGARYGAGDPYLEDLPPLDDARYAPEDDPRGYPASDTVPPPSFLAAKASVPADPSRGLAGSPADRFAGGDPEAPPPAPPPRGDQADLDDWAGPGTAAVAAATARPSSSSRQRYEAQRATPGRESQVSPRNPVPGPGHGDRRRRSQPQDAQELFGPAWEPARRYEAYPSLRTRIGLPAMGGIPRLGIAAVALVLAAAALFFVGPMLLGLGGNDAGSTPVPVATEEVTATPEPTLPPAPTPQVYVIAKGDTMSKIARKFGITVEELLKANPQVKNPDKIKVGQQLTIPVPVDDAGAGGTVDGGTVQDSASP